MPATMRILGWKAQGLRCPDHEISCADSHGNPYPISIIQMPNGTGKTTTLALLRAALSGSANNQGWDPSTISEYRKKHSNNQDGQFEVRLLLNQRRATITMVFDFENGKVTYKTTHGPGHREGFYPPPDFRRFMNDNFVNFYVFDGELAQHLLDKRFTDAQIVVENLFQMNSFDALKHKVDEYWNNKALNSSATEKRGLSRRQNRVKYLEEHLKSLKKEQSDIQRRRAELEEKLRRKKDAYEQEIDKEEVRSRALNDAKETVDDLNRKMRDKALDVLDRMRDPHALSSHFADWMLALTRILHE
ncbi:MAG: AAA family ATPase [Gammaproteobacteria bacterium]|nr:AAA family ATPase [Gammaproteobacteria bacterium]